ncbi:MAG: hypothetical protein WBP45_14910 [Daejeonella sp.]
MQSEPIQVLLTIQDGVVMSVHSNNLNVKVSILDFDDIADNYVSLHEESISPMQIPFSNNYNDCYKSELELNIAKTKLRDINF